MQGSGQAGQNEERDRDSDRDRDRDSDRDRDREAARGGISNQDSPKNLESPKSGPRVLSHKNVSAGELQEGGRRLYARSTSSGTTTRIYARSTSSGTTKRIYDCSTSAGTSKICTLILILLHMCSHTTTYVFSYYYMRAARPQVLVCLWKIAPGGGRTGAALKKRGVGRDLGHAHSATPVGKSPRME